MFVFVTLLLALVGPCSTSPKKISPLITDLSLLGAGYSPKTGWIFYAKDATVTETLGYKVVQSRDLKTFLSHEVHLPLYKQTSQVLGSECGVYISINGYPFFLTTDGVHFDEMDKKNGLHGPSKVVSNGTHLVGVGDSPWISGPCSKNASRISKTPWGVGMLTAIRGRFYAKSYSSPIAIYEMHSNASGWQKVVEAGKELFGQDGFLVSPSPHNKWLFFADTAMSWISDLRPGRPWTTKDIGFYVYDVCCFQDGETCPFIANSGLYLFNFSTTEIVQIFQKSSATGYISITCEDNGELLVTGTRGLILRVPETFGLPSSDWKFVTVDNGVASYYPTNIWGEGSNFHVSVADGPIYTSADGGKTWAADPQTRPLPTLVEVPCEGLPQSERPSTGEWCSYGVGVCPASTASCLVVVERRTLNTYYHALPVADARVITILNNSYIVGAYEGLAETSNPNYVFLYNTTIYVVESPVSLSAKWRKVFPETIVTKAPPSFASTGSVAVLSFLVPLEGPCCYTHAQTYTSGDALEWNTDSFNTSMQALAVCQWGGRCLVFWTLNMERYIEDSSDVLLITRNGTIKPFVPSDKFRYLELIQHFPSAGVSVLVTKDSVTYTCLDFTDPNTCGHGQELSDQDRRDVAWAIAAGAARGQGGAVRVTVAYGSPYPENGFQNSALLFTTEMRGNDVPE